MTLLNFLAEIVRVLLATVCYDDHLQGILIFNHRSPLGQLCSTSWHE